MPDPQTANGKPAADPERQALESIGAIVRAALDQDGIRGPVRDDVERKDVFFSGAGLVAVRASPGIAALVARAKGLYAARRRRDLAFGDQAGLLCDPVWDLMLDLFVAHYEGRRVSVSSACIAACVAPTTALRWITSLEHRNLIGRTPDCADKRRQFVDLSAEGLALIERAIAEF